MTVFSDTLISVIVLGSIYSLVALGFVVVFRASKVFNFLHPQFMFVGVLIVVALQGSSGQHFIVAAFVALVATVILAVVVYLVFMDRVSSQPHWMQMILTFALGEVALNVSQLFAGTGVQFLDAPVPTGVWRLPGGGSLLASDVLIVAVSLLLNALLFWVLVISPAALRLKATAEDGELASYMGISLRLWFSVAWALAAGAAVIAGIAYSVRVPVDSELTGVGLLVFPAAIIGGMDSIGGAFVGAFILAAINQTASVVLNANAAIPVTFATVLVVLIFRPGGLFGSPVVERV